MVMRWFDGDVPEPPTCPVCGCYDHGNCCSRPTRESLSAELLTEDVATILGIAGHGCAPTCRAADVYEDGDDEHEPGCLCERIKAAVARP